MSINIGGAIIPLISAFAAHWWGWQAAMLTPGIISMALGIWLTLQLKSTPQEEGSHRQLVTGVTIRWSYVRNNKVRRWGCGNVAHHQRWKSADLGYWVFLNVLVDVIRIALNDWGNIWLTESHGVKSVPSDIATVMLFEVGGLLGKLFAGWGSDLLFSGK